MMSAPNGPEADPTLADPTLAALRRGDLAGATRLTLRCALAAFPREILGLADTLEVLDLSGTGLSALPDDLGRLHRLRVLFCSNNRFELLPPSLGDCAMLSQLGFRAVGLREIPSESLPPRLRWLTVTDNRLDRLPDAIGARPDLQKLMLAGNRLRTLPGSLARADALELLRLSANRLEALPGWLERLPRLAWLAFAGNPLQGGTACGMAVDTPVLPWDGLVLEGLLGSGASGEVHRARLPDGRAVALKLFRGAMTSDGDPRHEMAASLAAGLHPNLVGALARLEGHPEGRAGLAMTLLPQGWSALAGPPSLESCSRDVYAPSLRLSVPAVLALAHGVAVAGAHLHARRLLHGDLYAHNLLWDGRGACRLSDLGAAAFVPAGRERGLQATDVLAWGILASELLAHCERPDDAALRPLATLGRACLLPDGACRPDFAALSDALS